LCSGSTTDQQSADAC